MREITREFIELLRTTKVEQCRDQLSEGAKRCALGLGRDLLYSKGNFIRDEYYVANALHVNQYNVVDMNDVRRMTFSEIADELERLETVKDLIEETKLVAVEV